MLQAIDGGARELFVGRSVPGLVFGNMLAPGALDRKLAEAGWDGQHSERADPGERAGNLDEVRPRTTSPRTVPGTARRSSAA